MKLNKKKLNNLIKIQINHVDDVLFNGSILGGSSLHECMNEYKSHGIYHPSRRDLISALQRSLEQLLTLEAYVVANGHLDADPVYPDKKKKNKCI